MNGWCASAHMRGAPQDAPSAGGSTLDCGVTELAAGVARPRVPLLTICLALPGVRLPVLPGVRLPVLAGVLPGLPEAVRVLRQLSNRREAQRCASACAAARCLLRDRLTSSTMTAGMAEGRGDDRRGSRGGQPSRACEALLAAC